MGNEWPALPLAAWRDTYATLHMWTQIVGKVCLALTPLSNHFWNIAFQVMSRGLATPSLTTGRGALTITFDFVDHRLPPPRSGGGPGTTPPRARTVADFYRL